MKLSMAFSVLERLRLSFQACFWPALVAVFKTPLLIFRPSALKRLMFFEVWKMYGRFVDEAGSEAKKVLITPYAKGIVLDLGAGLGYTARYLDPTNVTKYIALEPNVLMHEGLKIEVAACGFTEEAGNLQILSCGAEELDKIVAQISGQVDTLVSVLMICSVPSPQKTISGLMYKVLKPGGQFLYYEHVASKKWDVRIWQYIWTPLWATFFDGCALHRPTDIYIKNLTCWEPLPEVLSEGQQLGAWEKEGEEDSLLCHSVGRFIKKHE